MENTPQPLPSAYDGASEPRDAGSARPGAERPVEQACAGLLSAVSHDLKNPLTTIRGTAQILQRQVARGPVDAHRLATRLAAIDDAAARMAAQLAQLSDLARVLDGQPLALERRPTDLAELVRRVSAALPHSEKHQIALGAPAQAVMGNWDPVRVERVVEILLSNALKYSPAGGPIAVTMTVEIGAAVLRVRDRGIGIPVADRPYVFSPFVRGRNVGRTAGSGIGLALAKRIVEQHGGEVAYDDGGGCGSTFTVRLPL